MGTGIINWERILFFLQLFLAFTGFEGSAWPWLLLRTEARPDTSRHRRFVYGKNNAKSLLEAAIEESESESEEQTLVDGIDGSADLNDLAGKLGGLNRQARFGQPFGRQLESDRLRLQSERGRRRYYGVVQGNCAPALAS